MTNDPAREFLCSVREAAFNVSRCRRKIEQLRSECERVTAVMGGAPGGYGDEHKDGMWAELADYCTELSELYKVSVRHERKVQDFIGTLEDPDQRAVLTLRYVDLLRWPEIFQELSQLGMYYSERQIYRIHGLGLEAARKKWEETHNG